LLPGADDAAREAAGQRRLPGSLAAALDELEANDAARTWLGETLFAAYVQLKRSEVRELDGLEPSEICDRYAGAY
jgi:glutamine synthetase